MCLSSVSLNTKKTKNGFVGVGYKKVYNYYIESYKKGIWYKAKRIGGQNEYSMDNTEYYPGFHIFLSEKDADSYDTDGVLIQVSFKEIICFGKNWTYRNDKDRPCVIANWQKIDRIIKND